MLSGEGKVRIDRAGKPTKAQIQSTIFDTALVLTAITPRRVPAKRSALILNRKALRAKTSLECIDSDYAVMRLPFEKRILSITPTVVSLSVPGMLQSKFYIQLVS